MDARFRFARLLAQIGMLGALCVSLSGCLHYTPPATPEEARARMMMLGAAMQNAGGQLRTAQGVPSADGVHTYVVNGRIVTCTTAANVTTCS